MLHMRVLVDTIHPQRDQFVARLKTKATDDTKLNDSPDFHFFHLPPPTETCQGMIDILSEYTFALNCSLAHHEHTCTCIMVCFTWLIPLCFCLQSLVMPYSVDQTLRRTDSEPILTLTNSKVMFSIKYKEENEYRIAYDCELFLRTFL